MQTRTCTIHAARDLRIETHEVAAPGPGEALVALAAGGICGSDLHYYQHGGFGPIRVREPMILGHEAAGTVVAVGAGVALAPGTRVALNPLIACGNCRFCNMGNPIGCLNIRFSGSAMYMPHIQGLFRDRMVLDARQCVPISDATPFSAAACAEPLAVCLHARNRAEQVAGPLKGQRVLITGAGPIGALCCAAAAEAGAAEIVVTDLQDFTLAVARQMGATRTINVTRDPEALTDYHADKGQIDVAFDCSGSAPGIASAIDALRPRGTLVQVGTGGATPFPLNFIVSKELTVQGTQRFYEEFGQAVHAIDSGAIDVSPIVTRTFPLEEAMAAFEAAGDRASAVKVHLSFAG